MTDYTDIHSRSLAAVEYLMSQATEILEAGNEFEDDAPFSTAELENLADAIESVAIDTLDIATSGLAATVNEPELFSHVQAMVEYWGRQVDMHNRLAARGGSITDTIIIV